MNPAPCQPDARQFPPRVSSHATRSDEKTAVARLEARIAAARRRQDQLKRANAIVREEGKDESWKIGRLETECGIREAHALRLLKPDFAGRTGFADFELSNNAANIRRMQDRIEAFKAEQARVSVTLRFPGGRVEDNATDCRVRIYHEEKPGPETIGRLKAFGFHWSPSLGCWQRLRNNAARHAATAITGVPWPKAEAAGIIANDKTEAPRPKPAPAPRMRVGS